jgi:hypothetical protein
MKMRIVNGVVTGVALIGVFVLAFGTLSAVGAGEPEKKVECKVICSHEGEEMSPECAEFLEEFTDSEGNIDGEALIEKYTDEEGNVDCDALLDEFSDCCPDGKKIVKIMVCEPAEKREE